jgi:hypothetical protein
MTFDEYKAVQAFVGGEIPPCVDCPEMVYIRCRDKAIECIKFIEYSDPDKRQSKRQKDYLRQKEKTRERKRINEQASTNV